MNAPLLTLVPKSLKRSTLKSEFHFPGFDQKPNSQAPTPAQSNEDGLVHRCYALVPMGEMSLKLSFIFRNGNRCTIPYAYVVRTEFDVSGKLILYTNDIQITVAGRGLDKIEERLCENQVKWIKQHAVSIDPHKDDVFITAIEMEDRK